MTINDKSVVDHVSLTLDAQSWNRSLLDSLIAEHVKFQAFLKISPLKIASVMVG